MDSVRTAPAGTLLIADDDRGSDAMPRTTLTVPAVELADGTWLGTDVVVLATGATPRTLSAPVEETVRDRVVTPRPRPTPQGCEGCSRSVRGWWWSPGPG